jgi:hypothetical protein
MSLESVSAQYRQRTGQDPVEAPKKSKAKAVVEEPETPVDPEPEPEPAAE